MALVERMSNGRPTKTQQLQIQKKLRTYFERGLSASFTARKTRTNVKTVCNYFNDWTSQLIEAEDRDFVEREKKERERIRLCYDNIICEEYELLDQIKREIAKYRKEGKAVPRYLIAPQVEILRTISGLTEKKGSFLIQMPLDQSVDKMILEKIKHANTR